MIYLQKFPLISHIITLSLSLDHWHKHPNILSFFLVFKNLRFTSPVSCSPVYILWNSFNSKLSLTIKFSASHQNNRILGQISVISKANIQFSVHILLSLSAALNTGKPPLHWYFLTCLLEYNIVLLLSYFPPLSLLFNSLICWFLIFSSTTLSWIAPGSILPPLLQPCAQSW